jgi:Ca-activated chloride channel family protein
MNQKTDFFISKSFLCILFTFLFLSVLFFPHTILAQSQNSGNKVLQTEPKPGPEITISSGYPYKFSYEIEAQELSVNLDGQMASIFLKQVIRNTGHTQMELDYMVPLPSEGAVSGLTLLVEGKELVGSIYDKDEAFQIYQRIVNEIRDPALLEYAGRGLFRARIFPIPPDKTRTLELEFKYLLPKDNGQISFSFPLSGPLNKDKIIKEQQIQVDIKNNPGINNLYSPLEDVKISKRTDGATATFSSSKSKTLDLFQLYFKVDSGPLGGLILSHKPKGEDGFFIFMSEPALTAKTENKSKNVVFVLDRSGSMDGKKFSQAKEAINFILERLSDEDNFNLVAYSTNVQSWQPELTEMNPTNRKDAKNYLNNLRSGGNTNISKALETSFKMLTQGKPTYLLFMTDGQPTVGITDELELSGLSESLNQKLKARLFSFGVGFDVNARLLDRLSGQAGGTSVFVNEEETIEDKVSTFFSKMTSPVLTDPELSSSLAITEVIPAALPDIFSGGQMVVVGRYKKGGSTTFNLTGKSGDSTETFSYKTTLASDPKEEGSFIEQLWAQRRIGQLIDELDLGQSHNRKKQLEELVSLSKKYGIMTPYTSFLAVESESITNNETVMRNAEKNLDLMNEVSGSSGNFQRSFKQKLMASEAPSSAPKQYSADTNKELEQMNSLDMTTDKISQNELNPPTLLAGKAFYNRQNRLIDGELTDKDLQNLVNVTQFSSDYYALAKVLNAGQKIWLSQNIPLLVKYNNKNYQINPAD